LLSAPQKSYAAFAGEDAAAAGDAPAAAEDEAEEEESDGEGWEAAVCRTIRVRRAKRAQRAAADAEAAAEAAATAAARAAERAAAGGAAADASESSSESGSGSGSEDEDSSDDAADDPDAFQSSIALVTADFAMQNVALQMGLRLIAPDGLRITRLQRWVLRCHACGGVTRDAARHFCGRCGNAALQRVTLTVDAAGTEHVGVRRRHNLRGTKYSLPAPKGGRYAVNPVLREDQLSMMRIPSRGNKPRAEADVFAVEFGHDSLFERPGTQPVVGGRVGAAAPSLAAAGAAPVVGQRARNPNERRHKMSNRRR
jgi:RNA-binding protein NOB1